MSKIKLINIPYKPSPLVVKVTHVPEELKDRPDLEDAFKYIVERLAVEVGDTWMPTALQTYGVPVADKSGVEMAFYCLPEPETKTINVVVAEVKNKHISRTLKEICKLCFKEKPVPKVDINQVGIGFDLLIYELDEAGLEVIDAWKLINFTIPYGLDIPLSFSKDRSVPTSEHRPLYSFPLEGLFFSHEAVIEEAAALHRFNSESKV